MAGYKEMAIAKLQEGYEKAKVKLEDNLASGLLRLNQFDESKVASTPDYITLVDAIQVQLKVPRNSADAYDAAIDMANWDVRETLELTHEEFQCFVRDIWDWSSSFATTNSLYKKF